MTNLKHCIALAAQGQQLGLLTKVRLYCKLQTFGRVNFNVRIQFFESDKYHWYRAKMLASIMRSKRLDTDNEKIKPFIEIREWENWARYTSLRESEYVVQCRTLNEYKIACEIITAQLQLFDVECEFEDYRYNEVPYDEDELATIKLQNKLTHQIEKLTKITDKAEIYVNELIYGRWVKKEIKDANSVEEILQTPTIAKAVAELNIYKSKIKKYSK